MDRDTLAETIFARMAAPYGDAITPALTQQLRIQSNLAAEDILEKTGDTSHRRKRRWQSVLYPSNLTPEEVDERNVAVAEAYISGKSLREVADEFDMSHSSVAVVLDHLEVERRPVGRPAHMQPRARVVAMKRAG